MPTLAPPHRKCRIRIRLEPSGTRAALMGCKPPQRCSCCLRPWKCPQWVGAGRLFRVEGCPSDQVDEKTEEACARSDSDEGSGKYIECHGDPERDRRLSSADEKSSVIDFGGLPRAKEVLDEQKAKRGEHDREPNKHRRVPEIGGRHSSLLIECLGSAMGPARRQVRVESGHRSGARPSLKREAPADLDSERLGATYCRIKAAAGSRRRRRIAKRLPCCGNCSRSSPHSVHRNW